MSDLAPSGRPLGWTWLGRASYQRVWDLQEELRNRILAGDEAAERLIFVEHDPVVTLGRHADEHHLLFERAELERRGIEVVRTNRGGDVTYHGPGQLVIYPVMRLAAGLPAHLEAVAGAIVAELAELEIAAAWRAEPAGVWVGDGPAAAKIAACGMHISKGVAIHGFALNVTREPLAGFTTIVPCGLAGVRVTSIATERDFVPPDLEPLAARLAARICRAWERPPVCCCDRVPAR